MINGLTYDQLADECHANNARWWHDLETGERLDRNPGELIMLAVSEIAEAMEGERKGLMDDKLPHRYAAEVELVDAVIRLGDFARGFGYRLDTTSDSFAPYIPENKGEALLQISHAIGHIYNCCAYLSDSQPSTVSEQIRYALEMIKAYARRWGYDLDGAYVEKTVFNKVRRDHTAEARKAAGGKKW